MKRTVVISIVVLITLLLVVNFADAQCAMCKQTATSATQDNKGIGEGLNAGIIYLMITPYLLVGLVALVFFRKKIVAFFRS